MLKITTKYVLRRVSCVIKPRVISHQRCGSDDTEHMLVVRENYVFVSFGQAVMFYKIVFDRYGK